MQLIVTKSNTLNAFSWIKQGWRLFTLQPGPFMGMSAIIVAITLLANVHQIVGIIVLLLTPFLTAGLYQSASRAEKGETLTVTDVFVLLSSIGKYRVFLRLATFSVLLSIPMTLVLQDMMLMINEGSRIPFSSTLMLAVLLAVNFMLFAFAIPAAWISPEKSALELMKQSFVACWINAIPLTIYGLMIAVLTLISMPIILVGWLIMYAVGALSFYQMFLTIYQPETPAEEAVNEESNNVIEQPDENETEMESLADDEKPVNEQDNGIQQKQTDRTDN